MRARKRRSKQYNHGLAAELQRAVAICICDINGHCKCYKLIGVNGNQISLESKEGPGDNGPKETAVLTTQ